MPWEFKLDGWPDTVGGFLRKVKRPSRGAFHEAPGLAQALAQMGACGWPLVEAEQVHGSEVAVVSSEAPDGAADAGGPFCLAGMDGLITDQPGIVLAIYVADCLAVYLYHRAVPAIGLAHAGWRGLADGMAGKFARAALAACGGTAADLEVLLSPCIGPCCFEVGPEVAAVFEDVPRAVDRSRGTPHVDLRPVATEQLESAGVPREQIQVRPQCTCCNSERFASYRAEGEDCGRNVALIALSA